MIYIAFSIYTGLYSEGHQQNIFLHYSWWCFFSRLRFSSSSAATAASYSRNKALKWSTSRWCFAFKEGRSTHGATASCVLTYTIQFSNAASLRRRAALALLDRQRQQQ